MLPLAETLERFNRKERHWLVRDALGTATSSKLDKGFLERVEGAVRRRDPGFVIDHNAWWAIDYHLDWLIAALHILEHGEGSAKKPQANKPGLVKGNQQDIDLVIASGTTLVLVEAKGVGSWSGSALKEKVARLSAMTASGLISHDGYAGQVRVHFVLCSPRKGGKLKCEGWPTWAKSNDNPLNFPLRMTEQKVSYLKVERCNSASKRDALGKHWHVLEDSVANNLQK